MGLACFLMLACVLSTAAPCAQWGVFGPMNACGTYAGGAYTWAATDDACARDVETAALPAVSPAWTRRRYLVVCRAHTGPTVYLCGETLVAMDRLLNRTRALRVTARFMRATAVCGCGV